MPPRDPIARKLYNQQYYERNKARILQGQSAFYSIPENKDQRTQRGKKYRTTHQDAISLRRKIFRQSHKGIIQARNKQWREQHPEYEKQQYATNPARFRAKNATRRARRLGATVADFTQAQWAAMKEVYHHCCAYCGKQQRRLTQDHITPLVHGGTHTYTNIVPACRSCNSKKGTKAPLVPVQPLLML